MKWTAFSPRVSWPRNRTWGEAGCQRGHRAAAGAAAPAGVQPPEQRPPPLPACLLRAALARGMLRASLCLSAGRLRLPGLGLARTPRPARADVVCTSYRQQQQGVAEQLVRRGPQHYQAPQGHLSIKNLVTLVQQAHTASWPEAVAQRMPHIWQSPSGIVKEW
eukprot:356936-Chlamydomonas_euryale.AAC.1